MSEVELRRNYRHDRVLIDSDRVLTPQFDDAVIYLTGAHLEMLRNVTQYLRRRETYVEDTELGYYLMPDDTDYDDILAIVADLEEALMGNPNTIWGYKDRWMETPNVVSTGEAYTDVVSTSVPSGYVYHLEKWSILHYGGQTCAVDVRLCTDSDQMVIFTAPALAHNDYVVEPADVTLKEGDFVQVRIYSLPDTKAGYLNVWGHTMVVPD